MRRRVGIPRAMGYYYLYPFYRTLVQELGADPVVSPPTTAAMMERMEVCPTDEPCLAVKLHFSHADALAQRQDVDVLLLPVIARVERTPCCPKFIGVADMIRNGLRLPPERVAMPVLDIMDADAEMCRALQPLTERLGVHDRHRVLRAITSARRTQQICRNWCVEHGLTTPEAFHALEQGGLPAAKPAAPNPAIAVIGHPYIIYEHISLGMIDRLRASARVVTAEMVPQDAITRAMTAIPEGERMWPFEAMLLGAALHLLRTHAVDKMILVGSFECGPESIIEAYIEEEAQRQGVPLMVLALDEHSGDAGLLTRLEAFLDTERIPAVPQEAPPAPHGLSRGETVIGLPSMGYLDVAVRTAIECCGVRTLPTPRTTRLCVELGREVAPEFICFPFTATLGQLRYLLEHGANTLVMVGGKGYCRLGWYGQVQEALLRRLGYDFNFVCVDTPFPLSRKWAPFQQTLRTITGGAPMRQVVDAVRTGMAQLDAMERIEAVARRLRAYERTQGSIDQVADRCLRRLAQARSRPAIRHIEREFREEAATIETEETRPVRVRVTGEIWVVLEQSATREVMRWLGARSHPRVLVDCELSVGHWIRTHLVPTPAAMRRERAVLAAARPWLHHKVGGHGQISIGHAALARQEGMDGVLHVFPFTCMPEIIAQNIMVRMAEDLDLPILTYIVSEQTGEAGMETRLEAFLDVLEERRDAGDSSMYREELHALLTGKPL